MEMEIVVKGWSGQAADRDDVKAGVDELRR
jgi:hypothetical protein